MNASRLSENALRKKLQNLEQQSRNIDQQHRVIKLELQRRAQAHRPAPPTVAQLSKRAQNAFHTAQMHDIPYKYTRNTIINIVDGLNPPPSYRNDLVRRLAQFVIIELQRDIDEVENMGVQNPYTRNLIQRARASIRSLQQ